MDASCYTWAALGHEVFGCLIEKDGSWAWMDSSPYPGVHLQPRETGCKGELGVVVYETAYEAPYDDAGAAGQEAEAHVQGG